MTDVRIRLHSFHCSDNLVFDTINPHIVKELSQGLTISNHAIPQFVIESLIIIGCTSNKSALDNELIVPNHHLKNVYLNQDD